MKVLKVVVAFFMVVFVGTALFVLGTAFLGFSDEILNNSRGLCTTVMVTSFLGFCLSLLALLSCEDELARRRRRVLASKEFEKLAAWSTALGPVTTIEILQEARTVPGRMIGFIPQEVVVKDNAGCVHRVEGANLCVGSQAVIRPYFDHREEKVLLRAETIMCGS